MRFWWHGHVILCDGSVATNNYHALLQRIGTGISDKGSKGCPACAAGMLDVKTGQATGSRVVLAFPLMLPLRLHNSLDISSVAHWTS